MKPPTVGESFVWMEASPGRWGEQLEVVAEVQEEKPKDHWLCRYNDGWSDMYTLLTRDKNGRLVRAVDVH